MEATDTGAIEVSMMQLEEPEGAVVVSAEADALDTIILVEVAKLTGVPNDVLQGVVLGGYIEEAFVALGVAETRETVLLLPEHGVVEPRDCEEDIPAELDEAVL